MQPKKKIQKISACVGSDVLHAYNDKNMTCAKTNINGFHITPGLHYHPLVCYSFRIESNNKIFTFITDVEHVDGLDERVINIASDSDVLVHDSQYFPDELKTHKLWGHSSYEQAIAVKQKSNSKKLFLTHHAPTRSDKDAYRMLEESVRIDPDVELATEQRKFIKI